MAFGLNIATPQSNVTADKNKNQQLDELIKYIESMDNPQEAENQLTSSQVTGEILQKSLPEDIREEITKSGVKLQATDIEKLKRNYYAEIKKDKYSDILSDIREGEYSSLRDVANIAKKEDLANEDMGDLLEEYASYKERKTEEASAQKLAEVYSELYGNLPKGVALKTTQDVKDYYNAIKEKDIQKKEKIVKNSIVDDLAKDGIADFIPDQYVPDDGNLQDIEEALLAQSGSTLRNIQEKTMLNKNANDYIQSNIDFAPDRYKKKTNGWTESEFKNAKEQTRIIRYSSEIYSEGDNGQEGSFSLYEDIKSNLDIIPKTVQKLKNGEIDTKKAKATIGQTVYSELIRGLTEDEDGKIAIEPSGAQEILSQSVSLLRHNQISEINNQIKKINNRTNNVSLSISNFKSVFNEDSNLSQDELSLINDYLDEKRTTLKSPKVSDIAGILQIKYEKLAKKLGINKDEVDHLKYIETTLGSR